MESKAKEKALRFFETNCYENPPVELMVDLERTLNIAIQKERRIILENIRGGKYFNLMALDDELEKQLEDENKLKGDSNE